MQMRAEEPIFDTHLAELLLAQFVQQQTDFNVYARNIEVGAAITDAVERLEREMRNVIRSVRASVMTKMVEERRRE